MPLTPEDVASKRFTPTRFKTGYDEEEVDAFLDEVEAELRRLRTENNDLRQQVEAAESRAAAAPQPMAPPQPPAPAAAEPAKPAEEPQEQALRTLLLAQRTADDAIAQAKSEAEQLVAQAKSQAVLIEEEAARQHAAAMVDLQRQRGSLESAIEGLRGFEREYRTRLKAYLEGQLRDLAARPTFAPPGGPGAAGAEGRPASGSGQSRPSGGGAGTGDAVTPPTGQPGQAGSPFTTAPRLAEPAGGSPTPPAPPGGAPTPPPAGATQPFTTEVDADSDVPSGPPNEASGSAGEWRHGQE